MADLKTAFKNYFITGLIAILPLWLTVVIVWLVFKWIGSFTSPFLTPLFHYVFGSSGTGFFLRLTSFILAVVVIWSVGYLTTHIIGRRFLIWIEGIVLNIPLLNGIYGSARKLIQYIFTTKRDFKRVVLIQFPRQGSYAVGFVMGTNKLIPSSSEPMVNIFLPTTPNPTTGFLLFMPEKDTAPLDISVDDAVKLVISGGIIMPSEVKGPENFGLPGGTGTWAGPDGRPAEPGPIK